MPGEAHQDLVDLSYSNRDRLDAAEPATLSPAAGPGCPGPPLCLLLRGLGPNVFCSQRIAVVMDIPSRAASTCMYILGTHAIPL